MRSGPRPALRMAGAVGLGIAVLVVAGRVAVHPGPVPAPPPLSMPVPTTTRPPAVVGSVALPDPIETLAADGNTMWGIDQRDNVVMRVDTWTMRVTRMIRVDDGPWNILRAGGSIWLLNGGRPGVWRLDPATGRVLARTEVANIGWFAAAGGALWIPCCSIDTNRDRGFVSEVSLATGRVIGRIPLRGQPGRVAAGEGVVWILDGADQPSSRIWRLDAASGQVVRVDLVALGGAGLLDVATGPGVVWATTDDGALLRLDPATGRLITRFQLDFDAGAITPAGADVWLADRGGFPGRMVRVDARTGHATGTLRAAAPPMAVATPHALWIVTDDPGPTLTRIDPSRVGP